jgi:thioredoxin 1
MIDLNEKNFEEEVKKYKGKVLVDFYADWCGPCQMLGPIVEEVAKEAKDFKVARINVDDNEDIAREYGVMSIPCVIAYKDGKEINRSVGLVDKDTLLKLMED